MKGTKIYMYIIIILVAKLADLILTVVSNKFDWNMVYCVCQNSSTKCILSALQIIMIWLNSLCWGICVIVHGPYRTIWDFLLCQPCIAGWWFTERHVGANDQIHSDERRNGHVGRASAWIRSNGESRQIPFRNEQVRPWSIIIKTCLGN